MIEAVQLLKSDGWKPPVCIAVYGLFAEGSDVVLEQMGARLVTTNSVPHRSNAIELQALLAEATKEFAVSQGVMTGRAIA